MRGIKRNKMGRKAMALCLAAAIWMVPAERVWAADVVIDDTTVMLHKEKQIKIKSAKSDRILFYRNAKNQMRVYVCPSKKAPTIYKLSKGKWKKDKTDPMVTFTRRKKRTKPYGDYGTPIWNKTKTAFYTEHFNTIYKCSKKGKILKKVDVLKKLGLDKSENWMRKIEWVDKEIFAVSIMNAYDDSESIYLYDFRKNKVKKQYDDSYQRLLGATKTSLYLLSYEDEEPDEIVKVNARTEEIEERISAKLMVGEWTKEVIGTVYQDELYLCNEKGLFLWNEYCETFDQYLDGEVSFEAGVRPYRMIFTAEDTVFIATEQNRVYCYTLELR